MFKKLKQSITPTKKGKQSSSANNNNKNNAPAEDESTSLLSSGGAPSPTINTTTTAAAAAATEQLFHQQMLSARHLTELDAQGSLSIEEMERGAKRLISDNFDESDSVNNLLNDDGSIDSVSSSLHGGSVAGYGEEHMSTLTASDLEYLASQNPVTTSVFTREQQQSPRKQRQSKRRIVDDIGNQLLEAQGNARLESDILRKSLNLDGNIAAMLQEDADKEEKEKGGGRGVLERIHESTRRLRAASIGSGGQQPPEIEKEEEDYEDQRKRMVRQVLTMVAVTAFLILLVCVSLALGTIAVGPPKQPVGAYKIIEAQVGNDFWQYYDFYAGKDSAGSNGHIMYVSEHKAREEGIVEVVTETVSTEDMIEIYDDGRDDPNWLAEDLAFLEEVKRKKLDKKLEKEVEAEKADKKKKKKDKVKKTGSSDSSAGTTTANDETKQTEDGVKKEKKANRLLSQEEEQQQQQQQQAQQEQEHQQQQAQQQQAQQQHAQQQQLVIPELGQQQPASPDLDLLGASNNETEADESSRVTSQETTDTTRKPPKLEPFNPDPTSDVPEETFVVISSTPTPEGPRNSVRLEGRRRFNRGLFIIDLRHMPAGCGTWPAFWLTDEANWPVNGEIDIVEGVNYQDTAKTALHSTRECRMDDVPEGSKTGTWDTAIGIPNRKTGIPDMTFRYAQDCFVYDPHQWINQGCVASDLKSEGRSLGVPLNRNGGGVYALEWDPVYKHIKSWIFSPHGRVPRNLREALRTATNEDESTRVAPDTNQWGLPYGHFPIGDGTNCPAGHFRNMRLVINLAFCGSVAGTRYFMDCPKQFKKFKTCEEWVESDPDELKAAYWKIRGVYVYEREWQKQWS